MSLTHDINGKESSKRLWATRLLKLGIIMAIFFVVMWFIAFVINREINFPTFLRDIWLGIMGAGTTVIFGTVFEKPKNIE